MRSVIGVNSVRATLEKSLLRAQKRFNLSNPSSVAKNKRSQKKVEDRKLTKILIRIARQARQRFGSDLPDDQVAADWKELCVNPIHLEFEPSVDKYTDFVNEFKSQTTIFDKSASRIKRFEPAEAKDPLSSNSPAKKKKGETKRLRKLRKLYKKTLAKLKSIEPEDEEGLIPKAVRSSKLEVIREERKKARTLQKAIRKEAQRIRLEQQTKKEAEATVAGGTGTKKQKLRGKSAMKDMMTISTSNGDTTSSSQVGSTNGGSGETEVAESSPLTSSPKSTTNVTAKLTLITNGTNRVVKKQEPQLPKPKYTIFPRDKVQVGWSQKYPTGCGFINLGNSCYMNSTLQAVFHIPSFVNWILNDNIHRRQCQSAQRFQQCLVCSMRNTLEESMRQSHGMQPHQIHNKLRIISKNFLPGRQEDAHEFLRHLLESMEVAYLRAYGSSSLDTRSKETTPLGQIFGGYLRTEVACLKCRFVSTTFQQLAELQLDIRHATTVEDAITYHFRKERVDNNDYKCEGCRAVVPVMKQFSLELAPVVLCLQLKRFTLFGGKLSKPVHCNQYLDLTKYLHKSLLTQDHRKLKYRMVSLITHIGSSPNGGHYTAIAEASNGTLYQFDDSYVRDVSATMAQNSDAYVIIYEMVRGQDTKPGSPSVSATAAAPIRSPGMSPAAQIRASPGMSPAAQIRASPGMSPAAQIRASPGMSAAAQIRNGPLTNGFGSATPKPSTATSATASSVTSYPVAKPSKLVFKQTPPSPSTPGKFVNRFADKNNPDRKPTSPFSRTFLSSSPSSAPSAPATNGNRGLVSQVKPRNERPLISFSMKNTAGETGVSKAPNVRSCLTPLRPPFAPQQQPQREKTPPPKHVNGTSKLSQSPTKPHSLVPYDNEDDSEEGTPRRNSRERSVTPSNNGDTVKVKKFDATLITAPIKSWNDDGGSSILAKATEMSRKRDLLKSDTDLFNEELDAGRVKKQKLDSSRSPSRDGNSGVNKFQNYEDQKRIVNERTKLLNLEPSKSLPNLLKSPSAPQFNGFGKDPHRSHHHSSGTANGGGDSRPTSNSHSHSSHENSSRNNHSNRPNHFSRNNEYENNHGSGGGGFKRHGSAPSHGRFNNGGGRSHHGGGGGGKGSWRESGQSYYKGNRHYANYYR